MARAARTSLLCLLLTAGIAHANGRFPATNQLVVEPGNPDHAVVRATFGLLVTRDRGITWEFVCEEAFGPQNSDPPLALLSGGTIVLGLDRGVSRSDRLGCRFELASGIDGPVTDVTASLGEAGTAYALTVDDEASRVWRSIDEAARFELVSELPGLSAVTLDVAPSQPDVSYVSGVENDDGVLYRSGDRGQSFERFSIPGASGSKVPYLVAVDPTDADTLYVRTYGIPGALLQSRDGGRTFSERPLELPTPVQGFALSADGSVLVAANPFDGTFRAEREAFAFEQVRCGGTSCLGFAGDALLGCGSESLDGFLIGVSRDEGESFSRVLAQSCIPGPIGCPDASGVVSACANTWPELRARLGAGRCEPVDVAPNTACFGSSDAGGAGGAGMAPVSPAETGGAAGASFTAKSGEHAGPGCGCRTAPRGSAAMPWGFLALAVVGRARQRSRRARNRTQATAATTNVQPMLAWPSKRCPRCWLAQWYSSTIAPTNPSAPANSAASKGPNQSRRSSCTNRASNGSDNAAP